MTLTKFKERLQDLCRTADKLADLSKELVVPDQNRSVDYYQGYRDAVVGITTKMADELVESKDYEQVLASHHMAVRDLDVLINGESGAAKQANLSDLYGQIREVLKSASSVRTIKLERLVQRTWDWRDRAKEIPEDLRQEYDHLMRGVPDRRGS